MGYANITICLGKQKAQSQIQNTSTRETKGRPCTAQFKRIFLCCSVEIHRMLVFYLTTWIDRGITAICTLTEENIFKSFERVKNEFKQENKDLFRYLRLRHFFDTQV